jgi:hypothetical protein
MLYPRMARKDQPAFKVKSMLKGTEYESQRPVPLLILNNYIFLLCSFTSRLGGMAPTTNNGTKANRHIDRQCQR